MRWYQAGQADHCLLLSIVAITSRLSGLGPLELDHGRLCAELAQKLILRDQRKPTVIKAQALLLIIRYQIWNREFMTALVLMATLSRFAFALRFNYENPNLCSLAQESRRRLMWAIFILDTMLAGDLPDFTLCPSSVIHVQLPCTESNFELDISGPSVPLRWDNGSSEIKDLGLLAYYIRVISLRDRILRYGMADTWRQKP